MTATASGGSTASGSQTITWTVAGFTLVNPGPQQSVSESSVSLDMSVSNPGSLSLTYSATGLPAGLSINTSTGAITGTLSSSADTTSPYTTTVTATDGSTIPRRSLPGSSTPSNWPIPAIRPITTASQFFFLWRRPIPMPAPSPIAIPACPRA